MPQIIQTRPRPQSCDRSQKLTWSNKHGLVLCAEINLR